MNAANRLWVMASGAFRLPFRCQHPPRMRLNSGARDGRRTAARRSQRHYQKGTTTGTSTKTLRVISRSAPRTGRALRPGFVGYKTREVAVTAGVTFLDIVLGPKRHDKRRGRHRFWQHEKATFRPDRSFSVKMDASRTHLRARRSRGLLQGGTAGLQIAEH